MNDKIKEILTADLSKAFIQTKITKLSANKYINMPFVEANSIKPLYALEEVKTDLIYISLYPFVFDFTSKEELLKLISTIQKKNNKVFFLCYVETQDPKVIDFL